MINNSNVTLKLAATSDCAVILRTTTTLLSFWTNQNAVNMLGALVGRRFSDAMANETSNAKHGQEVPSAGIKCV